MNVGPVSGRIDGKITSPQELRGLRKAVRDLADSGTISPDIAYRMRSEIARGKLSYEMCVLLWAETKDPTVKAEIIRAGQNGLVIDQGARPASKESLEAFLARAAKEQDAKPKREVAKKGPVSEEKGMVVTVGTKPAPRVGVLAALDEFMAKNPDFFNPPKTGAQVRYVDSDIPDIYDVLMPKREASASRPLPPVESLRPEPLVIDVSGVRPPVFADRTPTVVELPAAPRRESIEENHMLHRRLRVVAAKHLPRTAGGGVATVKGEYQRDEVGNIRGITISAVEYQLPDGRVRTETNSKILAAIQDEANGGGG